MDLLVSKLQDQDPSVVKSALDTMGNEIRTSTSSMTAIPKPLKFLRLHYDVLKEFHATMSDTTNKVSALIVFEICIFIPLLAVVGRLDFCDLHDR